jgi:hypothetical protein
MNIFEKTILKIIKEININGTFKNSQQLFFDEPTALNMEGLYRTYAELFAFYWNLLPEPSSTPKYPHTIFLTEFISGNNVNKPLIVIPIVVGVAGVVGSQVKQDILTQINTIIDLFDWDILVKEFLSDKNLLEYKLSLVIEYLINNHTTSITWKKIPTSINNNMLILAKTADNYVSGILIVKGDILNPLLPDSDNLNSGRTEGIETAGEQILNDPINLNDQLRTSNINLTTNVPNNANDNSRFLPSDFFSPEPSPITFTLNIFNSILRTLYS